MAAQGPPGVGVMQSGGGGPIETTEILTRQHLAFFHASTCQEARWRITISKAKARYGPTKATSTWYRSGPHSRVAGSHIVSSSL